MNKVTNRLRLVDGFFRGDNYYGHYNSNKLIKDFFNIKNIDLFLGGIDEKLNEIIANKKVFYFMYKQKEDILDYLKSDIEKNGELYSDYANNEKYSKLMVFKNKDEVDIFKKAINAFYGDSTKEIINAFRDGTSKESILKAIDFFINNNLGRLSKNDIYDIKEDNLKDFIKNNRVWSFSNSETLNVIENHNELSLSFAELDDDSLDILKNKNAKFLCKLDKFNLDVVNKMMDIVDRGFSEDSDPCFLVDNYMYDGFRKILNNLIEGVNSYVDIVIEKYDDDVVRAKMVKALLDSFTYEIISKSAEMELLVNKVKYDFKPESVREIGLEFSGIKEDIYLEANLNEYSLASIIDLKTFLPKGFFKKIINNSEFVKNIMFINKENLARLSRILELSQLNDEQVEKILRYMREKEYYMNKFFDSFSDVEYKLSYEEFMYVYKNRKNLWIANLNNIKDMKQSARLLKLKSIVALNELLSTKDFSVGKAEVEGFIGNNDDIQSMMKKDNPLNIKDLGDYIEYKIIDKKIPIKNISLLNKIKFLLGNKVSLNELGYLSEDDIDNKVWSSKKVANLIKQMNLSEDFKNKYKDNIISFCISEEYGLVNSYYKNSYSNETQRKGIMLIGKSIIANKYEDLKFVREDIRKEISMDITNEAFDSWKRTDVVTKDGYTVQDSSDFKYIMRMGEIPVRTCMNYIDGMYSHCLLSNFDTSKKMILIHKNGKYVGRAILRLTVMSNKNSEESSLDFVDVDSTEVSVNNKNSKHLVIFLEKVYTTLDSNDFRECYPLIIDLLRTKAKEMGVKLVVSYNYRHYVGSDCASKNRYVFITASKNGAQYLDSFDGSTSNSYCYKRGEVYVY